MCTILLAYQVHPGYPLVLAANRDVYFDRPTLPADFWEDAPQILAGKDAVAGGTWLGIRTNGRIAFLSNIREHLLRKNGAPSRGLLCSEFLLSANSPLSYLEKVADEGNSYNGFNLIIGDLRNLYYYSNRVGEQRVLAPGVYGLSNHLLDTPWPKVRRGKEAFEKALSEGSNLLTEILFGILSDRSQANDNLPDTGVGLEAEKAMSSIFITPFFRKPNSVYGTKSSTIILADKDDRVSFAERTYKLASHETSEVRHNFTIDSSVIQQ